MVGSENGGRVEVSERKGAVVMVGSLKEASNPLVSGLCLLYLVFILYTFLPFFLVFSLFFFAVFLNFVFS